MDINGKLEARLNNMEALEQALRKQLDTIEQQPPGADLTDLNDSGISPQRLIKEILRLQQQANETRALIRESRSQIGQTKELLKMVKEEIEKRRGSLPSGEQ